MGKFHSKRLKSLMKKNKSRSGKEERSHFPSPPTPISSDTHVQFIPCHLKIETGKKGMKPTLMQSTGWILCRQTRNEIALATIQQQPGLHSHINPFHNIFIHSQLRGLLQLLENMNFILIFIQSMDGKRTWSIPS